MKRKLFSMLLCAVALLLLMGAGVEKNAAATLVIEEESASAQQGEQALETTVQTEPVSQDVKEPDDFVPQDVVEPIPVDEITRANVAPQTVAEPAPAVEPAPALDQTLLVDGQPVPADTGKTVERGTTYVALAAMSKVLDPGVSVTWDGGAGTAVVRGEHLTLIAKVGQLYLEANGRYLYVPEGIWMKNGSVVVPLKSLTKAFDAALTWNQATGVTTVSRGSGAIASGEAFYNKDDLFWLSRIVFAESGNQPLEGKISVANVVLNRVKSPIFPNTVQGVLAQKNQFTTYNGGRLGNRTPNDGSVIAAKLAMDGAVVEETADALYFDSAANSWASRNKTYVATIGGHKFYR